APSVPDQRHGGRQQTPRDHDPGDPEPCSEPLERQIARHFKDKITKEEDAGAPAEHCRSETEIVVHLQCGEADIDAIKVAEKVAERDERHDPPADLTDNSRFHASPPGCRSDRALGYFATIVPRG